MVDLEKFKDLFLSEAHELLDNLDIGLIEFEKNPKDKDTVKKLMRYAHTLKGISAEMGFGELSNLSHSFEGMVENIKNDVASGGVETLFGVLDELRRLVEESVNASEPTSANPLVDKVGELEIHDKKKEAEMLEKPETFHKLGEVKVKSEKLDALIDLVAELTVNKLQLDQSVNNPENHLLSLATNARLVNQLQYQVLQLRLTPLFHVFNRFPRMVRDLGAKTKKKVEFTVSGGDIELDRSILDVIGEPLVHLLRNAVDHGLEKEGSVHLSAKREQNHVLVIVSDDGAGIAWDELKQKYLNSGATNEPTRTQLENFLFSGISTAKEITEISGRGVGLGVVKTTMAEVGGRVEVFSPKRNGESGTEFVLKLPVSLAIIKALLVDVSGKSFAVPLSSVDRLVRLKEEDIQRQVDQEVTVIDGEEVPLIHMGKIFGIKTLGSNKLRAEFAVVTKVKEKRIGFLVDKANSQQDIIVKPLSKTIKKQGYFSAVTILGDGEPVPIIDMESLLNI